jgi:hypothetical protein
LHLTRTAVSSGQHARGKHGTVPATAPLIHKAYTFYEVEAAASGVVNNVGSVAVVTSALAVTDICNCNI